VNFGTGLTGHVTARIASALSGTSIGTIQFRLGSTLYVTFTTTTGQNFVNVNWFQFS
jgi:hypothetical protein